MIASTLGMIEWMNEWMNEWMDECGRFEAMSMRKKLCKIEHNLKLNFLYLCVYCLFLQMYPLEGSFENHMIIVVFMYHLVFFCICFCFALLCEYFTFHRVDKCHFAGNCSGNIHLFCELTLNWHFIGISMCY